MASLSIRKAVRHQRPAKVSLQGTTGSGKTLSALRMARGLAGPEGLIVLIDSEHRSSELYADQVEFSVVDLGDDRTIKAYQEAFAVATRAGAAVIIIDSLSHAWKDALAQVDKTSGGTLGQFGAWAAVGPRWEGLISALTGSPAHVIVTMRAKTAYAIGEDERGKSTVTKLGTTAVVREDTAYEFDIGIILDAEHRPSIDKTRWSDAADHLGEEVDEAFGAALAAWLSGAPVDVGPTLVERAQAAVGAKEIEALAHECYGSNDPEAPAAVIVLVATGTRLVMERMPEGGYPERQAAVVLSMLGALDAAATVHQVDGQAIADARLAVGPVAPDERGVGS